MKKEDKWREITIGAIEYLQKQKIEANKEPNHVSIHDICRLTNEAVKTTLNKLVNSGEIEEIDTIHGKCYSLTEK